MRVASKSKGSEEVKKTELGIVPCLFERLRKC